MKHVLPPVLVVLGGLLVYSNSFHGEFVLDDEAAIKGNPTIRHLWPITHVLFPATDRIGEGNTVEGRPLLNLSFAVNYAVSGLEVRGYHAVNLGIHLMAGLLLYGLLRRTLVLSRFREPMEHSATWLALLVALIWVVHPLQTESVSYLSQRSESLVGMMYLLTMYLAVRGFAAAASPWWRAAAVMACVLGMTAKEVMVTAPVMVLLYDWIFVAETWGELWRRRWKFHAGMMLLGWGMLAAIMIGTASSNLGNVKALVAQFGGSESGGVIGHEVHWTDYARMQLWAVAHYLRLCFWPVPLIFYYGRNMAQDFWAIMPPALVVLLLLFATVMALWRRSWAGYVGAWFFVILAPTSTVIPLSGQTVAEHRMYLPLAAVVALVVVGGFPVWKSFRRRLGLEARSSWSHAAGAVLVALVLAFLGATTMARNEDYRTALALWQDTVRQCPSSANALNGLGLALSHRGRLEEATVYFREALEVDPNYIEAHYNLGLALLMRGAVDESIGCYTKAVELNPRSFQARNNLGEALLKAGRPEDAMAQFQKAIEILPRNAGVRSNLGNAFLQRGRMSEARQQYEEALKLDAECFPAHNNLGHVFLQNGQLDEAMAHLREALKIKPDYVMAHSNLGIALSKKGLGREALRHFEEAAKISPDAPLVLNNLARMLATDAEDSIRDGVRALELSLRANELSGGNQPAILQTLAAAYAETGRFTEADETAERALSFALAQGNLAEAEAARQARGFYQSRKPWRHAPTEPIQ